MHFDSNQTWPNTIKFHEHDKTQKIIETLVGDKALTALEAVLRSRCLHLESQLEELQVKTHHKAQGIYESETRSTSVLNRLDSLEGRVDDLEVLAEELIAEELAIEFLVKTEEEKEKNG